MNPLRVFFLTILVFFSASQLPAQDFPVSHVIVCNDGKLDIDLVTGIKIPGLFSGYTWQIEGWFKVPAGECDLVSNQNYRPRVYLAFAFMDSTGVWGWAKVKPESYSSGWKLTDMKLCAERAEFTFTFPEGDQVPATQCKGGGRFLIPASIDYDPRGNEVVGQDGGLVGGEFRVKFGPNDRATPFGPQGSTGVTAPSRAKPPADTTIGDQLIKELGKAAAEQRKKREEMQAEEAVQEKARAEASVRQNVCISDDLTTEWRNPSAGGKMATLKRLLIQSLRERANTPGYDQTRWIAVDSRYYSAWNPDKSFGKLVSTIPGGSCGAGGHREILALAP